MRSRFASYLCDNVFNVEETLAVIALYVGIFKLISPLYIVGIYTFIKPSISRVDSTQK